MEQQAVALDDSLSLAHSVMAAVYVQEGQYDQAITEAQRGIALDANSASGYLALAEVLNVQQKPAAALTAVEQAMRFDPRNSEIYLFEEGSAYTQLGRWDEAISALKRFSASHPDHLWSHVFLTDSYSATGDEKAARAEATEVERAAALDPNSAMGYLALAEVMNATARPAEALAATDKAMWLDPRNAENCSWEQGWAYTQLGRREEAISALKRFSARHPDDLWSHVLLVIDYIELGHEEAARAEATEVLRLNPQFSSEMMFWTLSPKGKALVDNERFAVDLRKAGLK